MKDKIKGKLLVGQSGGPTAVINASLSGVVQEGLKHDEIEAVYGGRNGILGILREELIDLGNQDPAIIENLKHTPSAALGSCRHKVSEADYERLVSLFKAHNIRYFMYIGGNDSMDTAHKIGKLAKDGNYELRVMGIPKTIDNDLGFTDHCPGFGSVARWIASSVRDAGLDTEAIGNVDRIKVVEIMGRNAGWITAASALARKRDTDAPHLIYVPERPIVVEQMLADVQRIATKLGYCVIAICEGAKGEDGKPLSASTKGVDVDAFGHAQMGGAADVLCKIITAKLGLKSRFDKPGTIQRVSSALASSVDIEEAHRVGSAAVAHAINGVTDKMVTITRESNHPYESGTGLVDLEKVANAEKLIPPDYLNEAGNDVTEAFLNYAAPLIGGPLPIYSRFEDKKVEPKLVAYKGK